MPHEKPKVLVLSSGAEKGMAELGTLEALYQQKELSEVETYIGCSVGAIIAYLLCIGYTPEQMMVLGVNIKLFNNYSLNLSEIKENYAILDPEPLLQVLQSLTEKKFGLTSYTFQELFSLTQKRLIIPTVNILVPEVIYQDYKSTPELDVLEAIRRSISIQPLFPPVFTDTAVYVDGAIIDPFPVNLLDDGITSILGIHTETIGAEMEGVLQHINLITNIVVDQIKRLKISQVSKKVKIITIRLDNSLISDREEDRIYLYYKGYDEGERYLSFPGNREKIKKE